MQRPLERCLTLSSPVGAHAADVLAGDTARTAARHHRRPGPRHYHFATADAVLLRPGLRDGQWLPGALGGRKSHQALTSATYGPKPQQVRIQDQFDRAGGDWPGPTITPHRQISDSLWGQTIPEIWHNDDGIPQRALPVTCRIAAGPRGSRISTSALGSSAKAPWVVVQLTPTMNRRDALTAYVTRLDARGQTHHGLDVSTISGNPPGSSLGSGRRWGQILPATMISSPFGRVGTTPSSVGARSSVALVLRGHLRGGRGAVRDPANRQKGVATDHCSDSHAMIAMISQGLTAWVWDHRRDAVNLGRLHEPV